MENTYPQETSSFTKGEKQQKFQYFKHLESQRMKPLREHSVFFKLLFGAIVFTAIGLVFLIYFYF